MDPHGPDDVALPPEFPAVEVLSSESGSPVAAPRSRRSPRRGRLLAGLATVMALVVGGGAYAAWSVLSGGGTQPEQLLPSSTVAFVKLDLNPSAGQKIDLYRLLQKFPNTTHLQSSDSDFSGWVTRQLAQSTTASNGLNFDKDIKPWLGDRFAVAVVPARVAGINTAEPVLVLAETDQPAATAAMNKLRSMGDSQLGYAFSDGYLVVSPNSKSGAADAVSAAQKAPLSANKQYQSDIASLNSDEVVTGWVDATRAGALMKQSEAAALAGIQSGFSSSSGGGFGSTSSGSSGSSSGSGSVGGTSSGSLASASALPVPSGAGSVTVNKNGTITLPDGSTITPPAGSLSQFTPPPDSVSGGSGSTSFGSSNSSGSGSVTISPDIVLGSGSGSGNGSGIANSGLPPADLLMSSLGAASPLGLFGPLGGLGGPMSGASWQGRWALGVHASSSGIELQVKTFGGAASPPLPPVGPITDAAPDAFVVLALTGPDRTVASVWKQFAAQLSFAGPGAAADLARQAKSHGLTLPGDIEKLVGSRLTVSVVGGVQTPSFLAVAQSSDPAAGRSVLAKLVALGGPSLGLQFGVAVRGDRLYVASTQSLADGPTSAGPTSSSLFQDAVADPSHAQEIAFVDLGPVWAAQTAPPGTPGGPSPAVQRELKQIAAVGFSTTTTGTTSTTTVRLVIR
jgi:hypothetical protein